MAVNVEIIRVLASQYRGAEYPFKAAGDPRGLGLGASALVLEQAAQELERLRDALTEIRDGYGPNHGSKFCRDKAEAALNLKSEASELLD